MFYNTFILPVYKKNRFKKTINFELHNEFKKAFKTYNRYKCLRTTDWKYVYLELGDITLIIWYRILLYNVILLYNTFLSNDQLLPSKNNF